MHFIEEIFLKLVKKHKTTDVYKICRLEKIICIEKDLHPEIKGIYQYVMRNRIITLNKNLNEKEKYFTCGHELGHAIIHKKYNCVYLKTKTHINIDRLEKEADIFSSLFQVPFINHNLYKDKSITEIADELNVSKEILELRLSICDFD